jgi:hypothetical protein
VACDTLVAGLHYTLASAGRTRARWLHLALPAGRVSVRGRGSVSHGVVVIERSRKRNWQGKEESLSDPETVVAMG